MQSRLDEIRSAGAEVIAITVDPPEMNRSVAERNGLEFPIVTDRGMKLIDAFDVRHVGGGMNGDIARPAVFILDESGRTVWAKLTDNWRVRVRPDEVLEQLARLD